MLGRRLLVIVAVLLGLAALTASFAPRQATRSSRDTAPPQAELEPRPSRGGANVVATEDVPSEPSLMTLSAQRSRQRVKVRAGRRVRLAIASTRLESAQIGEEGPTEAIDPDAPARFDLLYESPTRLEILVRDAGGGAPRAIGQLDVLPAR